MRTSSAPIMIVDDSPDDIALLRRQLTIAKVENPVLPFTDSEEALAFLRTLETEPEAALLRPGVLFLDINMPKVHGFVFLKWVRRQPVLDDVKVIVVSGSDKPEDRQRSMKLGADHYLVKFPPPDIFNQLLAGMPECLSFQEA